MQSLGRPSSVRLSKINLSHIVLSRVGLREYVISPSMVALRDDDPQYVRRRREIAAKRDPELDYSHQLSWAEMRAHKLPDSLLSGAVAGAVLSRVQNSTFPPFSHSRSTSLNLIIQGDVRAAIRGTGGMGILCTLLQLLYNESGVIRVKYISRKLEDATHAQSPVQIIPSSSGKVYVPPPEEPSRPLSERFFEYIGMAKISDEDFVQRLRVKRDAYLRRIAEIEVEREKERAKNAPTRPESTDSP